MRELTPSRQHPQDSAVDAQAPGGSARARGTATESQSPLVEKGVKKSPLSTPVKIKSEPRGMRTEEGKAPSRSPLLLDMGVVVGGPMSLHAMVSPLGGMSRSRWRRGSGCSPIVKAEPMSPITARLTERSVD